MTSRWLTLAEPLISPPHLYAWTPRNLPSSSSSSPLTTNHSSFSQPHSRIYIVGVGNLGRLFAMSLAKTPSKPPITLVVHRQEQLEEWIRRPGLEIHRGDAVVNSRNFAIEWWSEERPKIGPVVEVANGRVMYNVIVATKAAAATAQVDRFRRYLGPESTVAFAQNGMNRLWPPHGTEYINSRFHEADKSPNWFALVTKHGVFSLGPFRSRHASVADVQFGPVLLNSAHQDKSRYLTDLLLAGPKLEAKELSRADLWLSQLEKLVINASLNPTSASLRCRNGVVFAKREGPVSRVVSRIVSEASIVITALLQSQSGRSILGVREGGAIPEEILRRFSHEVMLDKCYAVGTLTKDNYSSMLQDFQAGRPTEIQEFNGWLVEMGAFLGVQEGLDANRAIVKLVEAQVQVTEDTIEEELKAKER